MRKLTQTSTTVVPTEPTQNIISGDVNNDLVIYSKDVLSLRQYLAEWSVVINEEAADVLADGTLNAKDVLLLRQYIAVWDVVLGK